jgi:hypothetical protein
MSRSIITCLRKKRYSSETLANQVREKCEAARGTPLRVYYCGGCEGYHLARRENNPFAR